MEAKKIIGAIRNAVLGRAEQTIKLEGVVEEATTLELELNRWSTRFRVGGIEHNGTYFLLHNIHRGLDNGAYVKGRARGNMNMASGIYVPIEYLEVYDRKDGELRHTYDFLIE